MAIFENSLFSSIPDSNIGGIHVLNHSLATMDSGSSRGGGKVFLIPKFNSALPQRALEVRILRGVVGREFKEFFHMVDFIYDFIQLLSGIIPRNGFCHH